MAERKRKQIDKEKVGTEYRAGKLSVREIARKNECGESYIRKLAKTEGWERDLSVKVDEAVRSKLVRSEVRTTGQPSEKEIIEAVSARSVEIVVSERKDLELLRAQEQKLLEELDGEPTKLYITQYQGQVVVKELSLTVSEKASALLALANVRTKRIELERKVWGISDPTTTPSQDQDSSGKTKGSFAALDAHILAMIPVIQSPNDD